MNCQVCLEAYNKSSQQCITCHFCDYKSCSKCVKRYILQTLDSHCMNCKREWSREFMTDNLSKSFVNNEYKKHKEKILFEKEKSLLTFTQPFVEREIQIEQLNKELSQKVEELRIVKYEVDRMKGNIFILQSQNINSSNFVQKCPNQQCRGFVSCDWKCNLCDTYICESCFKTKTSKNDYHFCDPNDVETANLIKSDCKKCPKCATSIHKIDGCDLMWCVMCHTAFNWVTGKIEKGNIHNPHYFDHLRQTRQQERNPLEVQCGRELDQSFIRLFGNMLIDTIVDDYDYDQFSKFYNEKMRRVIQLQQKVIPKLVESNTSDNMDLRISFMRNKITEDQWKRLLQQRQKKNERNKVITNLLAMYNNSMIDIFYRLCYSHEWDIGIVEMNNLFIYTRDELYKISDTYNCNVAKYVINI